MIEDPNPLQMPEGTVYGFVGWFGCGLSEQN